MVETDSKEQRRQALLLVDWLPEQKLAAARGLIEAMVEPMTFSQSLAMAPIESDALTDEMIESLRETDASLDRGEFVSHEEILREFGLRTE